ncbi:MAG: DUF2905 domain-containing protein [Firmicutes bacterium]|nr:DUF2905 domain-containing protein [Bacillota bacterium]
MPDFNPGKLFMVMGALLFAMGALFAFGGRFLRLGHLPGDIVVRRDNFTFYFPVSTCIALSILLSLAIRFIRR